jgi:hypothetical protein
MPIRSKFRLGCGFLFFVILLLGASGGVVWLAKNDVQSYPARLWFCRQYDTAAEKIPVLDAYRGRLKERELQAPHDIATFLAERYLATSQEVEKNALMDFMVASVSPRDFMNLPFAAQPEEVVGRLVARLPLSFEGPKVRALLLIETLRRGKAMDHATLEDRLQQEPPDFNKAAGFYRTWWSIPKPWPEKQKIDPFADSEFQWATP